jgi:hypothetical protein
VPRWGAELAYWFRGARRRRLFIVARWLVRRTGFDGLRRLGERLAKLQYALDGRTRRACLAGIAALLGRSVGDATVRRSLREA